MAATLRAPWFVWTSLASMTCVLVGLYWDISYHLTVGRDTFWTPAHILVQLGGMIGGASGTVAILATTLRRASRLGDRSIHVWGFRGPFGAFLATWGAVTMVVSAPFDDWWHSAYGLDVAVLSPPHTVLLLGILAVSVGGILSVVAAANRAGAALRRRLSWIVIAIGAEILVLTMILIFSYTFLFKLHHADSYLAIAIVAPLTIVVFARAAAVRWAASAIAAGYTMFMIALLWIVPLFPAEPKLGPVYQPITHYIPLQFPVLVIAPAVAVDLIRTRVAAWPRWRQALALGVVFVTALVAAEWPFASFLHTRASQNWVFGTLYHPYFLAPDSYAVRGAFQSQTSGELWRGLARALVAAIATSWIGLALGDAMRRVRR